MRNPYLALLGALIFALLSGCGPTGTSPSSGVEGTVCDANAELPLGHSATRMALDASHGRLYILDDYSSISRWNRSPFSCDWELDRNWESSGILTLDGFPEEIDVDAYGNLYVKDGILVLGPGTDTCTATTGTFAVFTGGDGLVTGSILGSEYWSKNGNNCASSGGAVGFGKALSVDADDVQWLAAESVGGTIPERLALYNKDGSTDWITPISANPLIEPYLCSADRVRLGDFDVVVLDKTCGRVATFGRDGSWKATILLDSLGIRRSRVRDVAIASTGVVELLTDDSSPTIQISWRALLGASSGAVISP